MWIGNQLYICLMADFCNGFRENAFMGRSMEGRWIYLLIRLGRATRILLYQEIYAAFIECAHATAQKQPRALLLLDRVWLFFKHTTMFPRDYIFRHAIFLQDAEHISDVGGVLGLWLSCSCISLVELLEFLASLVLRKCKRRDHTV